MNDSHGTTQQPNCKYKRKDAIEKAFIHTYESDNERKRTVSARLLIVAVRDVFCGEEITVTYGDGYWNLCEEQAVTNHMVHVCQMSSFIRVTLWSWFRTRADISMRIACEHRSEVMSTTIWIPRSWVGPPRRGTRCCGEEKERRDKPMLQVRVRRIQCFTENNYTHSARVPIFHARSPLSSLLNLFKHKRVQGLRLKSTMET